jgi:hypothetical protein
VRFDGSELIAVRFSPHRLLVRGVRRGVPTAPQRQLLLEALADPQLPTALRRLEAGDGLHRGTQFGLWLEGADPAGGFGFLEDAPAPLRALVGDLQTMAGELAAAPAAEIYLRAEPIAPPRLENLLTRGKLRFYRLEELPEALRPRFQYAVRHPNEFHPVDAADRVRLSRWSPARHPIYVFHDGSGYEVAVLHSLDSAPDQGDLER